MDCFRLDFWDKLVISITLILVLISCIFNVFVYADTSLTKGVLDNCRVNDGVIVEGESYIIYYELISGHNYKLISNRNDIDISVRFCNEKPDYGVNVEGYLLLPKLSSIDFSFSSSNRIVFVILPVGSDLNSFSVVDVSNGQQLAISSLVDSVGFLNFWEILENATPYILVVVVVGFGIFIIIKLLKKLSKGRSNL